MGLKLKPVVQGVICLLLGVPFATLAVTIETLGLGQAHVAYPEVAVYIDVLDETDAAVDSVSADQIQASVDGNWVSVTDLKRVAALKSFWKE